MQARQTQPAPATAEKQSSVSASPQRFPTRAAAARLPAWAAALPLQAKLTVNEPGDIYEQEADAVAEQVMRMAEPGVQRRVRGDTESDIASPLVDQKIRHPDIILQRQSRLDRIGRRIRRGIRTVERGVDRIIERGQEAVEDVSDAISDQWNRGSGTVSRIRFDGSQVIVDGPGITARAVSGLMANHPTARGIDYTQAQYQNLADLGPIPEGDYYLNPDEVESHPPGIFNVTAWGRYRTRLHETTFTSLWRRLSTSRTGGFFLHQDANHNGTAGCIGIWSARDNAAIHRLIRANDALIPVEVRYPAPSQATDDTAPAPTHGADGGTRSRHPQAVQRVVLQRQPDRSPTSLTPPAQHFLVQAGIDRLRQDATRYSTGRFPRNYYEHISRHLFEIALQHSNRDYGAAFSLLDDVSDGDHGFDYQREYVRLVGTDSANGWDKVRHFTFTAYLQYISGGFLLPEAFTYGKEIWDEIENLFGSDPEGYSVPDIRADNRGEAFAEAMRARELRERPPIGPTLPAPVLPALGFGAGGGLRGIMERDRRRAFQTRPGVQRKADGPSASEAPASVYETLSRPGQPLDATTRTSMESRFGTGFGNVRVHTDGQAAESARTVGARAYTVGQDVAFGAGEYAPNTQNGQKLIAHELTHVLQQRSAGPAVPSVQLARVPAWSAALPLQPKLRVNAPGDMYEQEADTTAERVMRLPMPMVQRDDSVDVERAGETIIELRPGLVQRSRPGFLTIEAAGRPWLTLEWDPVQTTPPNIKVAMQDSPNSMAIGLQVTASYRMRAVLDRSIEQGGDAVFRSFFYRLFSYDFRFPGTLSITMGASLTPRENELDRLSQRADLPYRHRELYEPEPSREFPQDELLNPPTAESLDPLKDSPPPSTQPDQLQREQKEQRHEDLIRNQPAFATQAEMEAYIRDHSDGSFIGITTSYGKFVARRVDEAELQRLAASLREDEDNLPEVAWDAVQQRSSWGVTGIYQNGRMVNLSEFANLYYEEDFFAANGRGGDFEEAEVFRVGGHSYGRKPFSHDEALARWRELDAKTGSEMLRLETEPGRSFVSLYVRGVSRLHELDDRYFRGRDTFNQHIVQLADQGVDMANLTNQINVGPDTDDVRYYLFVEMDREQNNPNFVATLHSRDELAEAVSRVFYDHVHWRAQQLALESIVKGADQLRPFTENADRMRMFVLGFPQMSGTQREDALRFIGVPDSDRESVEMLLSNSETAAQVALGLEASRSYEIEVKAPDDLPSQRRQTVTITRIVSIEKLMGWARDTVVGLDRAIEQLRGYEVEALWLEGDLGNSIRRQVYREFGFNLLDPTRFPHRDETAGWFPDPLEPGPLKFSSLGEQMYANTVHNLANQRRLLHVLGVTGLVVITVILILAAQEAGAVAAGYLWAEGTAAYIATELIVSGLVFTALNEVRARVMEGRWESESAGDLVGHTALNIATFGAFRFLNTLLAAGARSFVAGRVGEEAFVASRGAQRAAEALRITGVGATFMAVGIAQRLASGQGFSSAADFALFAYENLLTLALLEGGAVLARPLMTRGTMWAREQRLGAFEPEIVELRGNITRLQRELVSLSMRPQAASRDAPQLAARTRELLEAQRNLCERLRENFRNRSDAQAMEAEAGVELQRIIDALAGIRQAEFLTAQRITPVEGSESVFTYEGGSSAIARFRQFYGEERVQTAEDGTIRVEVPGLETRELVFVPADRFAAPARGGAPAEIPNLVQRQLNLQARQQALLARAKRLGVKHASLDAIRRLRPTETTRDETLNQTEEAIARAEREAGVEMERLTRNILKNVRDRLGAEAIDQIRAGELVGVSDANLADILWQARGLQNMGVAQLRALVFAAQAGEPAINFNRLMSTIRRGRFTVADRNFALETFTQLTEMGVAGARQMLADMSASPSRFRGGLFQMEVIRFVGGAEQVAGIEVRTQVGVRAREYDLILRDGTRIECKDWATWEYAESLADGFERDMLSLTGDFSNPSGLRKMQYFFRLVNGRPVRPIPEIRAFLRARLEQVLAQRNASDATRESMLRDFDDYLNLVQAPNLQRSGGLSLPPIPEAPPNPTVPDQDDEEPEH